MKQAARPGVNISLSLSLSLSLYLYVSRDRLDNEVHRRTDVTMGTRKLLRKRSRRGDIIGAGLRTNLSRGNYPNDAHGNKHGSDAHEYRNHIRRRQHGPGSRELLLRESVIRRLLSLLLSINRPIRVRA